VLAIGKHVRRFIALKMATDITKSFASRLRSDIDNESRSWIPLEPVKESTPVTDSRNTARRGIQ